MSLQPVWYIQVLKHLGRTSGQGADGAGADGDEDEDTGETGELEAGLLWDGPAGPLDAGALEDGTTGPAEVEEAGADEDGPADGVTVTGQTVVETATTEVVMIVECAGQFLTVGAQLVMV